MEAHRFTLALAHDVLNQEFKTPPPSRVPTAGTSAAPAIARSTLSF
jgi:hypothetical protein